MAQEYFGSIFQDSQLIQDGKPRAAVGKLPPPARVPRSSRCQVSFAYPWELGMTTYTTESW